MIWKNLQRQTAIDVNRQPLHFSVGV